MASQIRGRAIPTASDARRSIRDDEDLRQPQPYDGRYGSPSPSPYAPRAQNPSFNLDITTDAGAAASPSMIPSLRGSKTRRLANQSQRPGTSLDVRNISDTLHRDDFSQSSTSSDRKRAEYVPKSSSAIPRSPSYSKAANAHKTQPFDRVSPRLPSFLPDEEKLETPEKSMYDADDASLGAPTPYYYTHNDRTLDQEDIDQFRLQQLLQSSPLHFPRKPPTLSPPDGNSLQDPDSGTGSTDASYGKRIWTAEEDRARIRNAVNGSRIPFRRANGVHLASNYHKVRSNEGSAENTDSSAGTQSLQARDDAVRYEAPVAWGAQAKSNPHWLRRSLGSRQDEHRGSGSARDEAPFLRSQGRHSLSPDILESRIPAPINHGATPRRVSPSYNSFIPRSVSRQSSNSSLAEIADRRLTQSISHGALRESRVSAQNIMREPRNNAYEKYDQEEQEKPQDEELQNEEHDQDDDYTQDWEQVGDDTNVHEISDLLTADIDKMLQNAQSAIDAIDIRVIATESFEDTQELPVLPQVVNNHTKPEPQGVETTGGEDVEGEPIPGTPIVVFQSKVTYAENLPKPVPTSASKSSDLLRDLARATSRSPSVSPQPQEEKVPFTVAEDSTEEDILQAADDTLSKPTPRVAGAWVATPQTVKPKSVLSQELKAEEDLKGKEVVKDEDDATDSTTSSIFEIIPRSGSPLGHKSSSSMSGLRQRITKADLLAQSKASPAIDDTIDSLRDMIENDTDFSSLLNIPLSSAANGGLPEGPLVPPFNRTPVLPVPGHSSDSALPSSEERAQELAIYSMLSDRLRSLKEQIHGARKGVERLEATVDSSLRVPCTSLLSHLQSHLQKSRLARLVAGVAIYILLDWVISFGFELSRAAWRRPGDWELSSGLDEHTHCDLFPFTTPILAVRLIGAALHRVSMVGAWLIDTATSSPSSSSWTASVTNWWAVNSPQNQGENWCWGHDSASLWRWAMRELTGGSSPPS